MVVTRIQLILAGLI